MVSQCANPGCGAEFLYFHDGRLFAAPRRNSPAGIEYFWLCAHCARNVDLKFSERDDEPRIVPRQPNGKALSAEEIYDCTCDAEDCCPA
jgi:hypothetical protein